MFFAAFTNCFDLEPETNVVTYFKYKILVRTAYFTMHVILTETNILLICHLICNKSVYVIQFWIFNMHLYRSNVIHTVKLLYENYFVNNHMK